MGQRCLRASTIRKWRLCSNCRIELQKRLLAPLILKHPVHMNRRLNLRRKTRRPTNYTCVRSSACLASTNGICALPSKCSKTRRGLIPVLGMPGRDWRKHAFSWRERLTPHRSGTRKVKLRCGGRWHWTQPMHRPIARTAEFSGRRLRDTRTARPCWLSANLCGGVPAIILHSFGSA